MDRNDVYKQVARRIDGCTRADVKTVFEVYAELVKETVKKDGENATIILPDLGKFYVKHVPARSGISNFDGKPWEKPERNELKFQVCSSSKDV